MVAKVPQQSDTSLSFLLPDNPFLSVMPEALILPLGDRQFQISITAASTTGREIPTTPNLSSFTFTLTDVNRGNIPVQIIGTTLASQYIRCDQHV